jgi:hypothetical protein
VRGWLEREKRRLRVHFLEKVKQRDVTGYTFERWLDWEYYKGLALLGPWFVSLLSGEGASRTGIFLLIAGGIPAVFWWGFVTVQLFASLSNYGDKYYHLVTKHKLSKEYRDS